jgi:hypothetical protein
MGLNALQAQLKHLKQTNRAGTDDDGISLNHVGHPYASPSFGG